MLTADSSVVMTTLFNFIFLFSLYIYIFLDDFIILFLEIIGSLFYTSSRANIFLSLSSPIFLVAPFL